MGAYNKGGIKFLCEIAKPHIAIITGVNEQHLATFKTMANLLSAEGGKELVQSLPGTGLAIFNANSDYLRPDFWQEEGLNKKIFCSTKERADYWAEAIRADKDEIFFRAFSKEISGLDLSAKLVGAYNVENLLLAISCARELGMTFWEIKEAVAKISSQRSALKLFSKNGIDILDATYSANPNSVLAHLEHLANWAGKKAVVMSSLIELGFSSDKNHSLIGAALAEKCDLAIITTDDGFEAIKSGAKELNADYKIIHLKEPAKIISRINEVFGGTGGVLLLESRVPKEVIAFFEK
jgi:UDP-N-acetylmuramoyl-tripeptide--D-alanyl-D-alanine ligase